MTKLKNQDKVNTDHIFSSYETIDEIPWLAEAFDQITRASTLPAILIVGRPDIGKTFLAKFVAVGILCSNSSSPNSLYPCKSCRDCHLASINGHPDLHLLPGTKESEGKITIQHVRDLVSKISKTSHRGGTKVVIINRLDLMSPGTGNALLKILEDANKKILFLLLTDKLHQTLPTIRSRCHKINVPQPKLIDAMIWLKHYSDLPENKLRLALAMAGFSPLRALKITDDKNFWLNREKLLDTIVKGANLVELVESSENIDSKVLTDILFMLVYDTLLYFQYRKIKYHFDYSSFIEVFSKEILLINLLKWQDSILNHARQSTHTINRKLALEALFSEFLNLTKNNVD